MATTQIPRSVRELILRDLARQTRTPKAIADRHHVPVEAVTALRDHYGPNPVELLAAAEQLARPAGSPAPVPAPPVRQRTGHPDGLSSQDRRTCRAWALLTGRSSSSAGPMARDVVTEWLRLGRPEAPQSEPTPEPAEEAPEEAPDDEPEAAEEAPEAAPYCATCDDTEVVVRDGKVTACACSPEDDVIDAPIVCGACGEPLPDPTADGCPYCDAEFERVQADKHAEWSEFYVQCLTIPELATECEAVAAAVYRLRDAHAEHLHREQLIMRVQDAIKPHLHLTSTRCGSSRPQECLDCDGTGYKPRRPGQLSREHCPTCEGSGLRPEEDQ